MKKLSAAMMSLALFGLSAFGPGSAAAMRMSVTPKIWSSVENYNAFDNALISDSASGSQVAVREQVNIPLFGAAFVMTPGEAPLDFMFNFYGGSTEGNFLQLARSGTTQGTTVSGKFEAKRTDIEMLLRFRPKDTTVNFFTGLRVNSFEDTLKIVDAVGFITNPIWTATNSKTFKKETTIVLWELGAGFFSPISANGKHRFFGNTTFGIGSFRSKTKNATSKTLQNLKTGSAVAWDVNTGYEWLFSEHFSFNARYRMYAKPTSPLKDRYDFTVVHGPDFGLTARF